MTNTEFQNYARLLQSLNNNPEERKKLYLQVRKQLEKEKHDQELISIYITAAVIFLGIIIAGVLIYFD